VRVSLHNLMPTTVTTITTALPIVSHPLWVIVANENEVSGSGWGQHGGAFKWLISLGPIVNEAHRNAHYASRQRRKEMWEGRTKRGGCQMKLQAMHKMQMKCANALRPQGDTGTIVNVWTSCIALNICVCVCVYYISELSCAYV